MEQLDLSAVLAKLVRVKLAMSRCYNTFQSFSHALKFETNIIYATGILHLVRSVPCGALGILGLVAVRHVVEASEATQGRAI